MLKGQDVVVLLKLLGSAGPAPVRDLASQLGFDVAGTHRAMRRLGEAGLYSPARQQVIQAQAEEFLIHAAKFSFPPRWGSEARGIPTSWAADPLKGELAEPVGLPPVWPYSKGTVRGLARWSRSTRWFPKRRSRTASFGSAWHWKTHSEAMTALALPSSRRSS